MAEALDVVKPSGEKVALLPDVQPELTRKELPAEKARIERAKERIRKMDNATFIEFQRELQYAKAYYQISQEMATRSCIWDSGEALRWKEGVMEAYMTHGEIENRITNSPLYDAVRQEIQTRFGQEVPNNWTGWLAPERKSVEDLKEFVAQIEDSLKTIFMKEYPVTGMIYVNVGREEAETAREKIWELGIKETFINGHENLLAPFESRWGG